MRLPILLLSALPVFSQVSAVRTSVIRYNDQYATTGRAMGNAPTYTSNGGDTFRCALKSGATYLCTLNDGHGPSGATSSNIAVMTLSLDLVTPNNTSFTMLNTMSSFGGYTTPPSGWSGYGVTSWKSGGLYKYGSNLYWTVFHQCNSNSGVCSGLIAGSTLNNFILTSTDGGVHWCNPKTWAANSSTCPSNSTTAAGDEPSSSDTTAIMWSGASNMGYAQFVQYAAGDSIDNNSTYGYALSVGTDFKNTYLSRFPVGTPNDVSTWTYYVGPVGGDVNNSSNWSSSAASQTVIFKANTTSALGSNYGDTPTMSHLPSPWNSYAMIACWQDANGTYRNRPYWAKSMTGPFTPMSNSVEAVVNEGLNFPQFLLDTLSVTDSTQKTGTIAVISGGPCCTGVDADYSPFFSTYALGPGSPATGLRLTAPGLHLQSTSKIQLSSSVVPGAFINRNLQQLWLFNDQAPLPTLWPSVTTTEWLGGTVTCTPTGAITLSAIGMVFPGTGNNLSSGNRCTTSANAPSFLAGDGTYTIWAVFKANASTSAVGALFGTGTGTTRGQLFMDTSQSANGDMYVGNYASDIALTAGSLVASSSNYYFAAITKTAGIANSTRAKMYFSGAPVSSGQTLAGASSAPNVAASPIYFGAAAGTGSLFGPILNGTLVAIGIHNAVLTPVEIRAQYIAAKRLLLQRGAVLQ